MPSVLDQGQVPVAIIGGGLGGLALSIAMHKRSIPYKIYEARDSFTEIGAGINLGPNIRKAFEAIDPSLGEAAMKLCTRNPPERENVWMQVRLGAPSDKFRDAELLGELMSPPAGSVTVRRNDLLNLLAEKGAGEHGNAVFNKKLVGLDQSDSAKYVTLKFSDGTEEIASIVIGCDGIHSAVRRCLVGADNPAAKAQFSKCGAYRAVVPIAELERAVGTEIAATSNVFLGPNGYVVLYPVEGGKSTNIGFWPQIEDSWTRREWVIPDQREKMEKEFEHWGTTVHKIMAFMGNPAFYATHHHSVQPDSWFKGRVCLIGDAAHSMPPHQGAGASQAMEDAYVLAEVLGLLDVKNHPSLEEIEGAFAAFEAVRKPRSQRILETSMDAMAFWSNLYRKDLTTQQVEEFIRRAHARLEWIWYDDIVGQADRARSRYKSNMLNGAAEVLAPTPVRAH